MELSGPTLTEVEMEEMVHIVHHLLQEARGKAQVAAVLEGIAEMVEMAVAGAAPALVVLLIQDLAAAADQELTLCLLYTSPSPRD